MDITYFGTNTGPGPKRVKIRHSNGNTTFLKRRIMKHSRDGFNWGYGGSGPADLALNILFDYLIRTHCKGARCMAMDLYQSFKRDFIAHQGKELSITGDDIEKWLGGTQTLLQVSRQENGN